MNNKKTSNSKQSLIKNFFIFIIIFLAFITFPLVLDLINNGVIFGYYIALGEILLLLLYFIYTFNREDTRE
ncbi:hypothetical protein BUY22_02150 [Staphylococcus cohnii]|nr:hypothetical protein BUY22_02150 [Staphylococcus cohnii]